MTPKPKAQPETPLDERERIAVRRKTMTKGEVLLIPLEDWPEHEAEGYRRVPMPES